VLITSPYDGIENLLNVATYQQMIGRAGRAGIDTLGESTLFCAKQDHVDVRNKLAQAKLPHIESHLFDSQNNANSAKQVILEVISNRATPTLAADICDFIKFSFFHCKRLAMNSYSESKMLKSVKEYL